MEINFSIWSGGLDSPGKTAEKLASDNVSAVEMHSEPFLENDEKTIETGAKTFKRNGVTIFSVHAPFGDDDGLSDLDDGKRRGAVEKHKILLRRAAIAGVSILVIHPGAHAEKKDIARMEDILLPGLEQLVKIAEKEHIKLALENMPPGLPGSESVTLRGIIEKISSPHLGVCFDTGHAHIAEEGLKHTFETLKDLVAAFHIHDNDGTRDMHIQPPYGTIDWAEFSTLLQKIRFEDPMMIEAFPWAGAGTALMLAEVEAVFQGRQVLLDLDGRKTHAVCPVCGRYVFESDNRRSCGCIFS